MMLVSQVCDYVYVLDFGKQLFEGTIGEVQASPEVRAAYLGQDEIEVAASAAGASRAGSS
jgi:ABC-type uncharacterized transport system ATPase subunit